MKKMKNIILLQTKVRMSFFHKSGITWFLTLFLAVSAFAQDPGEIKTIRIATPSWEGQTNKDGTGLFFEIVRKVYEPAGIKMEFEIVPWKRATKMVKTDKADARLCVVKSSRKQLFPNYPLWVEYVAAVYKKEKIKEWEGVKTLEGKVLIWLRGYDWHKSSYLKDLKLKWNEIDDRKQAWGMLESGRVDCYIDALIDINNYFNINKIDMTPFQVEVLWGDNSYVAFSITERSKKLIEIYDKRIIELFKSGELKKIFEKWNVRFSPDAWKK